MNEYEDDIRRYRDGSMTGSERNALEKKALDDPFLSDALEGVETISAKDLSTDLAKLSSRIQARHQVRFIPLRIAAGIAIVLSVGSLFYYFNFKESDTDALAIQKLKPTSLSDSISAASPDSSSAMLALSKEAPLKERIGSPVQQPKPAVAFTTPLDTSVSTAADVQDEAQTVSPAKAENETVERIVASPAQKSAQVPAEESKSAGASAKKDAAMKRAEEDVSPVSEVVILDLTNGTEARDEVAKRVTQMAAPVGGTQAFNTYIENNLRYPPQALNNKVNGKVTITFTVTPMGSLSDFKVIDGPGYGCNEEAIRLVKEGPAWTPSLTESTPVKSDVCVRIQFGPVKANK